MVLPHLVRNTFFQVFAKVVSVVGGITLTYVLGQRFGEEGFGVYTFVMSFVLFFGNLSDWGTPFITIREASKVEPSQRRKIFSTALVVRLFLGIVSVLLVNTLIRVNLSWSVFITPVSVASLVLVFLSLKTSFSVIFQTNIRFGQAAIV